MSTEEYIFLASVALGLIVWTIIARAHLWPALRRMAREEALKPVLLLHSFRFVGVVVPPAGRRLQRPVDSVRRSGRLRRHRNSVSRAPRLFRSTERAGPHPGLDIQYCRQRRFALRILSGCHRRLLPGQLGAAYFIPTVLVPRCS